MSLYKALVACALMVATLQVAFASTNYTVKWDLSTDYTKWVSDKTFHSGDNLIFSYTSQHNVWEVSKSDYDTCAKGTAIKQYTDGNTVIALTETGSRYFYCSTGSHCSSGMKIEVLVVSSTDMPGAPPSPSVVNSPPTPPAPYGAAAVTGVGSQFAIAVALGAMLMIFA